MIKLIRGVSKNQFLHIAFERRSHILFVIEVIVLIKDEVVHNASVVSSEVLSDED